MNGLSNPHPSAPVADSAFKTVPSSGAPALPPISTCLKDNSGLLGGVLPPGHHPQRHHHLPPQYPHHHDPAFHPAAGFKEQYLSTGGLQHPHSGVAGIGSSAHPAFPMAVPPWIQQTQAYNLAQLQHLLAGEKSLGVQQCLNDTVTKAALLDLGRIHAQYPLNKKLFGCPQCRYITDRKNNLKRHIATMHQDCDKALECCGITFKNKASLRDHVLIFHSNGYMCRFCGRNFCRKALLKRHLTVHSGQKDYICAHCDYATSHKSNLERHKKVHERQSQDDDQDPDNAVTIDDDIRVTSSAYDPRQLFAGVTDATHSVTHSMTHSMTRCVRDVKTAASLRVATTTIQSSSSEGRQPQNVVNQELTAHHTDPQLTNPLDTDLSLSHIDVVGVDIADQSSYIDVVQLHE